MAVAFHEIAVEPTAIKSLRDFQVVWGLVGFGKGRLIASFPQKGPDSKRKDEHWAWRVLESLKEHQPGNAKAVETLLTDGGKLRILRSGRTFDHANSWRENERDAHRERAFAAAVVEAGPMESHECDLDAIGSPGCPECIRRDQHVVPLPKRAEEFARALFPMMMCARTVRFVDAYYLNNEGQFSTRHGRVAKEVAASLDAIGRVPATVEFHLHWPGANPEDALQGFVKGMADYLPSDWKPNAYLWNERSGGRRFHARYILTDVGGAGSEYGLDQGRSRSADQTDVYLLTESLLASRIADFAAEGSAFELVAGPIEFCGRRRM